MRQAIIFILLLFSGLMLSAQSEGISINSNGTGPHSSAILDVQSTDKGMLIPRMDSTQRKAISNPATGLLVYDIDSDEFWVFNGNIWTSISNGTTDRIVDQDEDTRVMVEKQADEDKIFMEVGGNEAMRIQTNGHVGIGTSNPLENLEVNGAIKLGNTALFNEGSIRYTGKDFEGFDGEQWKSLTYSDQKEWSVWGENGNESQSENFSVGGLNSPQAGSGIEISGEYAIISAPGYSGEGRAYIYHYTESGWMLEDEFIESGGGPDDHFAWSVSISGDYAVISNPKDSINGQPRGSVYIYHRNGMNWTQQAKIIASDGDLGDRFGEDVCISGDILTVGAIYDDPHGSASGSAYIFKRNGTNWVEQQKISASDGNTNDFFGGEVAIDGDYAIIGAGGDNPKGNSSGSAYIFSYDGINWIEQAKLVPSDGNSFDKFGNTLAIKGNHVIVGASNKEDGGAAYVFERSGNIWTQTSKLLSEDIEVNDLFGSGIAIYENYAVVGASWEDEKGNDAGAAYVFQYIDKSWTQTNKLLASDGMDDDIFGVSLACNEDFIIVGAPGASNNDGKVYFFPNQGYNPLTLTGTELSLETGNPLDLSPILSQVSMMQDSDQDTRIEVEKSPDEDQIRFTTAGKESFLISETGLFSSQPFSNSGQSPYSGAGPGSRFVWIPGKSVLRIGQVIGDEWDDANLINNSSILGGRENKIFGNGGGSTIAGGLKNETSGLFTFIGGGLDNTITDQWSTLGGGFDNIISSEYGFVGGGRGNKVFADNGTVAGGEGNRVDEKHASIVGGLQNTAKGRNSLVSGLKNTAYSYAETVVGMFAEDYLPTSDTLFDAHDRLFVIGNGMDNGSRSNALTILKNGKTGIGTSNPGTELEVVGSAKFSADVEIGNGLQVGMGGIESQGNFVGDSLLIRHNSVIGNVSLGNESVDQVNSNQAGNGFTTTPWLYTNAIEAQGERGSSSTLLTVGNDGTYGGSDEIHFVTNGNRRLMINSQGRVGIGTSSPTTKFAVVGSAHFTNGDIGIGTTNPTKAKVEINGFQNHLISPYGFLNPDGSTGTFAQNNLQPYSLYASHRIAGLLFNAHSDKRIKDIIGTSNGTADLKTLMQIEITDYRMRDSLTNGNSPIKKVIAQQVAEVYPQAVSADLTEVVPDIYQRAEVQDGWIMLATDLNAGERVKLITENASEIYEVIEVEATRFKVSAPSAGLRTSLTSDLFVYGREVEDFHTVDYEAISMLNVSATQEQQRIIEDQQEEIKALKAENAAMRNAFEARLQALEAVLPRQASSPESNPQ